MNQEIFPGVWKLTLRQPESATPVRLRYFQPSQSAIKTLPTVTECPIPSSEVTRYPITLYEDDGKTYDYLNGKFNKLTLSWDNLQKKGTEIRKGNFPYPAYQVRAWRQIESKG